MALVNDKKTRKSDGYQTESLSQYDELVGMDKGFEVAAAGEPASPEEEKQFTDMLGIFMNKLHGPQEQNIVEMLESAPQFFQGVSTATMHLLQATRLEYEQKHGQPNPSVYFGEGGIIHSGVDAVFAVGQAIGREEAQSTDQYTAAMMDTMRKVGEYVQGAQEDGAVDEAQEFLLDIEMGGEDVPDVPPLDGEDRLALEGAVAPPQEEVPPPGPPAPGTSVPVPGGMPPESGGLV